MSNHSRFTPLLMATTLGATLCGCNVTSDGGLVLPSDTSGEESSSVEMDASVPLHDASADDSTQVISASSLGTVELDAAVDRTSSAPATAATLETSSVSLEGTTDNQNSGSETTGDQTITTSVPNLEWDDPPACVFQSAAVAPEPPASDAGSDAGMPEGPDVTLHNSPFLGPYLADREGYTLYIYTADFPGDCNNPPVSTCFDDCLVAWPLFEAGHRELAAGLDEGLFGTFIREDGLRQTTYHGWPLYYYKKDLVPLQIEGQNKGKIWYVAETVLPNVLIMRAPEERGGMRYLADGRGHTLYAYAGDTAAMGASMPRSACVGACREEMRPFTLRALRPVTALDPDDLNVFVRDDDGSQQLSYRGVPLYLYGSETRSGEMDGLLLDGFELIVQ